MWERGENGYYSQLECVLEGLDLVEGLVVLDHLLVPGEALLLAVSYLVVFGRVIFWV